MLAALLQWLLGLFGKGKDTTMFPGLIPLLRALVFPNLGSLKSAGLGAMKEALKQALHSQREHLVTTALERLTNDGDVAKLASSETFTDKDGVSMNGRQYFTHQCLWALPRVIMGGVPADSFRDDHFASWGLKEADALLAGVTDGRAAVEKVLERLIQQLT